MERKELEVLSREQLIAYAERLGVLRPRVLTKPELIDEIIGRTAKSDRDRQRARGWLGRARDLLARVVERGLHLPEAARVLRSTPDERAWPAPPPPLPTVTLAEIYAAQGHLERAIAVLDEVLASEPDHQEAQSLRARFAEQARARLRSSRGAPAEPAPAPAPIDAKPGVRAGTGAATGAKAEAGAAPKEDEKLEAEPAVEEARAPTEAAPAEAAPAEAAPAEAAPTEAAPAEAPAPPADLDEGALPERYNVDEIVAIAVDARSLYLYWEVRATTLARVRARRPEGWLGVRVVSVTASWNGPEVAVRDIRVDALYGDRFVREVAPGSNVRVSVGWSTGTEFEPFAVGIEVTMPHVAPVEPLAQEMAVWEPFSSRAAQSERSFAPARPGAPSPPWPSIERASRRTTRRATPVTMGPQVAPNPGIRRAPMGAPMDTGVELWSGAARSVEPLGSWHEPAGSSDLSRGGASELCRGLH